MIDIPTNLLISFGKTISLKNEYKKLNFEVKNKLSLEETLYNQKILLTKKESVTQIFNLKKNIHMKYFYIAKNILKQYKKEKKELYKLYPEYKNILDDLYLKEELKNSLDFDLLNSYKFKIIQNIIDFKSLHKTTQNKNYYPCGYFDLLENKYFHFQLSDNEFRNVLNKSFGFTLFLARYIVENKNTFLDVNKIEYNTKAFITLNLTKRSIQAIKIHEKLFSIIYELEDTLKHF